MAQAGGGDPVGPAAAAAVVGRKRQADLRYIAVPELESGGWDGCRPGEQRWLFAGAAVFPVADRQHPF